MKFHFDLLHTCSKTSLKSVTRCDVYEMYIAQDAFLKYFKSCLKGNSPDVETNAKRTQVCTSRHVVFSIALAHMKGLQNSGEVVHNEGLVQTVR